MDKNDVLHNLRTAKADLEAAIAAKDDVKLWYRAGPAATTAIAGAITLLSQGETYGSESDEAEGGDEGADV